MQIKITDKCTNMQVACSPQNVYVDTVFFSGVFPVSRIIQVIEDNYQLICHHRVVKKTTLQPMHALCHNIIVALNGQFRIGEPRLLNIKSCWNSAKVSLLMSKTCTIWTKVNNLVQSINFLEK